MSAPTRRGLPRPILWLLLALAGVIAAAWVVLVTAFPPVKLRALIQRQLGSTLSREVRFSDARLSLWPPIRLTMKDPALAEHGGFAKGAVFQARSVHLDLNVLALLARRLVVHRLEIDRPAFHVVLRPDGTTNLDQLAAPPDPRRPATSAGMDFAVSQLEIRDGTLLWDDLKTRRRLALGFGTRSGFSLESRTGRIRTEGVSEIRDLRRGPLEARRLADLNGSLARLVWAVEHRGAFDVPTKRMAIERLAVGFGRTELALAGTVDASGARPVVDLRARGSGVDLGEVLEYLSVADARALSGIRGSGRLEFDLGIRGAIAGATPPTLTGTLAVREGAFTYSGAPVGIDKTSFDARFEPDAVNVTNLTAAMAGQPVRGSFAMSRFADPQVDFALAGNLDLAAISRFMVAPDTKLEGRVAVDVRGRGRMKDPGGLALSGRAKLTDASVTDPQLPKRVEKIAADFEFSPARATIRGLRGAAGRSSFTLDATATRPLALLAKVPAPGQPRVAPSEIDFTLRSPYLDLAELLPPTPGGPLLPNARGHGQVVIARLKNKRLDVENVNARVDLEPTVLNVPRFTLSGYGGAVHGDARIGLANPVKPTVALKAVIDSANANALLSAWTGAGKLFHGAIGTTLELATDGLEPADVRRSLTAIGLARMANGSLGPAPIFEAIASFTRIPAFKEVKFKDFATPFRVENGRVATGPARLQGSYGEWLISGAIGFDGALDYAASITVPPELVSNLGAAGALAAGALRDPSGRVMLDLRVTGSAKSPRVAWDSKAMRDRLLGRSPRAMLQPITGLLGPRGDSLGSMQPLAGDSARAAEARKARRALEDSLKKAAQGFLRGLFGSTKRDSGR